MSVRNGRIDDALLAVPQLQKLCISKRDQYVDTLRKSLRFYPFKDVPLEFSDFIDQFSDVIGTLPDIEDFESPTDYCSSKIPDDLEVIPCSYPDSEVCFDIDMNLDSPVCSFSTTHEILDLEHFTHERLEEGSTLPFEEPLIQESFKQITSKILSTNLLIGQLQMYVIDDPLCKPSGKPWTEQDIFKEIPYLVRFQPVIIKPVMNETNEVFTKIYSEKINGEELLLPFVKDNESNVSSAYLEEIHNLTTAASILQCQQDDLHPASGSILEQNCKGFQLESLKDCLNDMLDIQSIEDFNIEVSESGCFESSPLIGFTTDQIPTTNIAIDDLYTSLRQNLIWSYAELPPEHFETFQNIMTLEQELKENELHYDEARLPEPVLCKDLLCDPLDDALQHLNLTTTEKKCLLMGSKTFDSEILRELHQGLTNPLDEVPTLKTDFLKSYICPLDKFCKMDFIKIETDAVLDYHLSDLKDAKEEKSSVTFKEPQAQVHETENCKSSDFHIANNPLDTFMHCRTRTFQTLSTKDKSCAIVCNENHDADLNSSAKDPPIQKTGQLHVANIVKIPLAGPYLDVVRYVMEYASPYWDKIKQHGNIPHNQSFMDISVDKMRFLYKETEQLSSKSWNDMERTLLQSYGVLLHIRITLDLIIHACLESAVIHLSCCIDSDDKNVGGSLIHLHEELFKTHVKYLESNCDHPKFMAVMNEIKRNVRNDNKIAVVIQTGLFSLQCALDRNLHRESHIPVYTADKITSQEWSRIKSGVVILLEGCELTQERYKQFSLVLQYDASNSNLKTICDSVGISYLGIISGLPQKIHSIQSATLYKPPISKPLTVISSSELTLHKKLVYTLEAKHNILIIERNYSALRQESSFYYADLILDLRNCIVLLALYEMYGQWDLEVFITRLVAVGFQCSFCYIIAHSIGAPSRYFLDKSILQNLYKLRASLSNLSRSSTSFKTMFKVIVCSNEDEVAWNIRAVADKALDKNSVQSVIPELTDDMSRAEACLLKFVCFNSYSAQTFLHLWTLDKIFQLEATEIKRGIPEISDNFLLIFEYSLPRVKQADCISISSESSNTFSVENSKTGSPEVSNSKGSVTSEVPMTDDNDSLILISSENSTDTVAENAALTSEILINDVHVLNTNSKVPYQQERSPSNNTEYSSASLKSPLDFDGTVVESREETKVHMKRVATMNNPDHHRKIPRNILSIKEDLEIFSHEKNIDIQLPSTTVHPDMQYCVENEKQTDKWMITRHPDFNKLKEGMGTFFDNQNFCSQSSEQLISKEIERDNIYTDRYDDCLKHPNNVKSENTMSSMGNCQNSSKAYLEDYYKTFENSYSTNVDHSDTNLAFSMTPFDKCEFDIAKNPVSLKYPTGNKIKKVKAYGVFSEKICRNMDKKEMKKESLENSNFHPLCFLEKNSTSTSSYPSIQNKDSMKRPYDPGHYAHHQPSKLSSWDLDCDTSDFVSLPFKVSRSLRNYKNQRESYTALQQNWSKYKSGMDLCCCTNSRVTKMPSLVRGKDQSRRNTSQPYILPSYIKDGFQSPKQNKSENLCHSADISFRNQMYINKQDQFVCHRDTNFETYKATEKTFSSKWGIDCFKKNLCKPSSIHNGSGENVRELQKNYCKSLKSANPSKYDGQASFIDFQLKSINKDYEHPLHISNNFIVTIKPSQNEYQDVNAFLNPSPPMDFIDDIFSSTCRRDPTDFNMF